MEENKKLMELYERFRSVPSEAIKPITAGRLKGKSDINPMWRIKILTEVLGPCGFGWKYEIVKNWLEKGPNETSAFCQINLFVKLGECWSEAIPGIGGSSFVSIEKNGPYQSDECFKMALTDAISVSCKALGVAADIYFSYDKTKYSCSTTEKKDTRKAFAVDRINDIGVMEWIYARSQRAKKENRRFSAANLLTENYIISNEDVNRVIENYESYIINNNLL